MYHFSSVENLSAVHMSQDSMSMPDQPLPRPRSKTFHDRVHDQMKFHPLICAIIDTPPFQRLRDLHQLGNCRYIYPGACNTRFEHSLGVSHLAMRMLRQVKINHEEEPGSEPIHVTDVDILCVGIAGLCHDLGHGPLSHMFEGFVNRVRETKGTIATKGKWSHEDASVQMIDYLLQTYHIDLSQYGLMPHDLAFIKILIHGLKPKEAWPGELIRRGEEQRFLFDIVANQRNGIDVDKMDYFLRDSMSAFGKLPDIHIDRILCCARVCTCEGQRQICFEEKVAMSLAELFQLRAKLHKHVYQHRVVLVLDHMTVDALVAAEDHFHITLPDSGKSFTLSETVEDMEAYVRTGDWIACALQWSTAPQLRHTRDLLERIRTRRLYSLIGLYNFKRKNTDHESHISEILQYVPEHIRSMMPKDIIFVATSKITLGSSGDDEDEATTKHGSHPPTPNTQSHMLLLGGDDEPSQPHTKRNGDELGMKPPLSPMPGPRRLGAGLAPDGTSVPEDPPRRDPLDAVRFFNPKKNLDEAYPLAKERKSPLFLPSALQEYIAFFFSRDPDFSPALYDAFQQWWRAIKEDKDNKNRHQALATPVSFAQPSPHGRKRTRPSDVADLSRPPPFHIGA